MLARTTHWTTRDGTRTPIRRMSDAHLANAIAMMERVAERRAHADAAGMSMFASTVNGEQAGYALDAQIDALEEHGGDIYLDGDPLYEALCHEQMRRTPEAPDGA